MNEVALQLVMILSYGSTSTNHVTSVHNIGSRQLVVPLRPCEDICKWRPITLLNTSYKIFAKLLSFRLQELQPKIIHESQTRFMWERSIMDNGLHFGRPLY